MNDIANVKDSQRKCKYKPFVRACNVKMTTSMTTMQVFFEAMSILKAIKSHFIDHVINRIYTYCNFIKMY